MKRFLSYSFLAVAVAIATAGLSKSASAEVSAETAFILSPVDNVRDPSPEVWQNTLCFIDAWKETR